MSKKILINALEKIACPHCDTEFPLQDGITNQLIEHYEQEYAGQLEQERAKLESRIAKDVEKQTAAQFQNQISQLQDDLNHSQSATQQAKKQIERARQEAIKAAKEEAEDQQRSLKQSLEQREKKLAELRDSELQLRKEKTELEDQQKELALEIQRKVDAERKRIEANSEETYKLREAEWRKKIEDAQRANEDMKRKLEQGSQQLQGEVLELEMEEELARRFPFDAIDAVRKGARGADVIQTVRLRTGATCGKIVWETKRAENWSNHWIPKLKDDQQEAAGEMAVLVTTALPADQKEPLTQMDGVWLVSPALALGLAQALRNTLIEVQRQKSASTGKGEKIEALYDYLCSPQFAQKIRSIVDSYETLRTDLEKEKAAMQRLWKKREAQIDRLTNNVMGMAGELQGLSGDALPDLDGIGMLESSL